MKEIITHSNESMSLVSVFDGSPDVKPQNIKRKIVSKKSVSVLPADELADVVTNLYELMKERRVLRKSSQSRADRLLQEYLAIKKILKNADNAPTPSEVFQVVMLYYRMQPTPTEFEIGGELDDLSWKGGFLDLPRQLFYNFDLIVIEIEKIKKAVKTTAKNTRVNKLLEDDGIKSFLETVLQTVLADSDIFYEERLRVVALSFSYYLDWANSPDYQKLPVAVQRHCDPEFMLREFYRTAKWNSKKPPIINSAWMNAVANRINGG